MSIEKPSLPKGTRDFNPAQMARRNYIIDTIKAVFRNYGFSQIETPAMENLSVLTGKYGDEGDQLLFKVLNSGDFLKKTTLDDYKAGSKIISPFITEKGLKYDLTVPFARYVVMNRNEITFPFKRFQIQPVWRADRPQKGRYREFYQCDADIIGSDSLVQEAEIILMINDVYQRLKLKDFDIVVNNRKILSGISEVIGMADKFTEFCVAIDKLDKAGKEKVFEELIEKGCSQEGLDKLSNLLKTPSYEQLNVLSEYLASSPNGMKGLEEVNELITGLGSNNLNQLHFKFDLSLARGLTYYTGTIIEVKPTSVKMGSITAGGRYDNLTGIFGLDGVSGIGISFGLDRIYDVLEELQLFPENIENNTKLMLACFDKESLLKAISVATTLRQANVSTSLYPEAAKLKKQFQYANRMNIPFVVVIGPEELEKGIFSLKNMVTGEQQEMTLNEIIVHLDR